MSDDYDKTRSDLLKTRLILEKTQVNLDAMQRDRDGLLSRIRAMDAQKVNLPAIRFISTEERSITMEEVAAWASSNPEDALALSLEVVDNQSSSIMPTVIEATDAISDKLLRVEVFKGHLAAARKAEVEAESRLFAAIKAMKPAKHDELD